MKKRNFISVRIIFCQFEWFEKKSFGLLKFWTNTNWVMQRENGHKNTNSNWGEKVRQKMLWKFSLFYWLQKSKMDALKSIISLIARAFVPMGESNNQILVTAVSPKFRRLITFFILLWHLGLKQFPKSIVFILFKFREIQKLFLNKKPFKLSEL